MDTLDKIYEMMFCELDDIGKKEKLDSKDVELIGDFVDIIKDILEIFASQDIGMMSDGYMRSTSGRMPMYMRGVSYMRGRSMAHNGNKDMILNSLSDIMDKAEDEKDRKAISRLIDQMETRS